MGVGHQEMHEAILRGGWKREAGQAPCGGNGISAGPSLCWWSSRALVSHGAASRYYDCEKVDQVPSGTWSIFVDGEPSQNGGSLPRIRIDNEYSAGKFYSFAHQLKTEV